MNVVTPMPPAQTTPVTTPVVPQTGGITGIVYWPDGTVAKNAPITIFPVGYNSAVETAYARVTTNANGVYSSSVCSIYRCASIEAYFSLDSDAYTKATGGLSCVIIMSSLSGPLSGFGTGAGARIDWHIINQACSVGEIPFNDTTPIAVDMRGTTPSWTVARSIIGG